MNKSALNIYNLQHLWKLAGGASNGFKTNKSYAISAVADTEWPNKIWIKTEISQKIIEDLKSEMNQNKSITFSYFRKCEEEISFIKGHFNLKSIQYGMSLELNSKFITKKNLVLKRVQDKLNATIWSQAFFESFGYQIDEKTISITNKDIEYYLITNKNELVGTIILLKTNRTIGIHGLGIIPSQRKKGYAREIISEILNKSIDQNYDLATLQASRMAKNIYTNLGFSLDFIMENFSLKK